jgi:predicted Rossmann-fold nucleotide-binding protein
MEIWVARHLGYHQKPIVVCDPFDFYRDLRAFLTTLKNERFTSGAHDELLTWSAEIPAAISAFRGSMKPPSLI